MKIEQKKLDELNPDVNNSRVHNEEQIQQLANSIKEFGFTNPIIIDEDNSVLAGHGRLKAATVAGLKKVPTLRLLGLTDLQKRAYILTDNKIGLNAEWDDDLLQKELRLLAEGNFDIGSLGWDEKEMRSFVGADPLEGIELEKDFDSGEEILFEDIEAFKNKCPRCGFEFGDV